MALGYPCAEPGCDLPVAWSEEEGRWLHYGEPRGYVYMPHRPRPDLERAEREAAQAEARAERRDR